MTRRDFLKTLLAVGAVSVAGISILDDENKLLELKDYPEVTYSREYRPEMIAYQHIMHMRQGDNIVYVSELADFETLPPFIINDMLIKIRDYNG